MNRAAPQLVSIQARGQKPQAPVAYPMPRPLYPDAPGTARPKVNRLPRGWQAAPPAPSATPPGNRNLPVPVAAPQAESSSTPWTPGFLALVALVALGMHAAMRLMLGGEEDSGITRANAVSVAPVFGALAQGSIAAPASGAASWRLAASRPVPPAGQ